MKFKHRPYPVRHGSSVNRLLYFFTTKLLRVHAPASHCFCLFNLLVYYEQLNVYMYINNVNKSSSYHRRLLVFVVVVVFVLSVVCLLVVDFLFNNFED